MHDFVRETSLTTEEWMFANTSIFLLFCGSFDLAIGRRSISLRRQGRQALIVVMVCVNWPFIYKRWSYCVCVSKSSYCYSTLLVYLPSSTRSTAPSPLVQPNPLSLDLSILRIRMKVRNRFSLWTFLIHFVPVKNGDSIASEGKGDYMFVEGLVVDLRGNPIPNAIIDTWETDGFGLYDLQVREQITFECFYVKKKNNILTV